MKRSVPSSEFLIDGSNQGRAEFCELGIMSDVESKKLFDGGGIGGVDGILDLANDFFEAAKEQDF
jgi:hypothetical protein